MSKLTITRLGEVCTVQNGFAFDSARFSKMDGTPLIRIRDLKTNIPSERFNGEYDPSYVVNPGDLLVGMDGEFTAREWRGPVALLNQRVCRLQPKPDALDGTYLRYAITAPLKRIEDETSFTTVKHLSSRDIVCLKLALPPLQEQKRIARMLNEQTATAEAVLAQTHAQGKALKDLVVALLRDSLAGATRSVSLADCLTETRKGVGPSWKEYPVLGATRAGLALAKEPVGKQPERYKLVDEGTIFYNPMRILLGSIATVDYGHAPGITSPDYVVFKCNPEQLDHRWFYHWLRSPFGEQFIKGLTRGAVRERLLFKRLAAARVQLPPIELQRRVSEHVPLIRQALSRLEEQIELTQGLGPAYLRKAFAREL